MTRGGLSEEEREVRTIFAMLYQGWDPDDPDSADGLTICRSVVRAIVAARTADLAAQVARVARLVDEWRGVRDGVLSPGLRRAADALSLTLAGLTNEPDPEAGSRATEALARLHRTALSPAQPDTERGGGS